MGAKLTPSDTSSHIMSTELYKESVYGHSFGRRVVFGRGAAVLHATAQKPASSSYTYLDYSAAVPGPTYGTVGTAVPAEYAWVS